MPFQLLNVGKIYLSTPLNVYDNVGNFCICKGTNFGEIIDVKTRTYKCLILYDSFAYDRYWSKSCRYSLFHHTCTHGIQFALESGLLWHASPWNAPISEQSIPGWSMTPERTWFWANHAEFHVHVWWISTCLSHAKLL